MRGALAHSGRKASMAKLLKKFYGWRGQQPELYEEALRRVEEWAPEHKPHLEQIARAPIRKKPAPKEIRAERAAKELEAKKAALMGLRQSTLAPPLEKERKKYRACVLDDQKRVKNKFRIGAGRRKRATAEEMREVVDNDCGLPPAKQSPLACGFQRWVQNCWAMHEECQCLQARKLRELDLQREPLPTIPRSQCNFCNKKRKYMVPKPEDVPEALQELSAEALLALSPFDIDIGAEHRACDDYKRPTGYRMHTKMFRLSWSEKAVKDRIHELSDRAMRSKAKAAFKYLRNAHDPSWEAFLEQHPDLQRAGKSAYRNFIKEHERFLHKHESPSARQKLRPLHFIEEVGIETALWPHLFWQADMCLTYERYTDSRREIRTQHKHRPHTGKAGAEDGESSDDTDTSDEEPGEQNLDAEHHSMKASFYAKLMSPLLGYDIEDPLGWRKGGSNSTLRPRCA